MGVNSLPKTVTRQHRNCDFNLCTFSKTGSVQVAATRHEVGKLLQVSVSLSEKPLHRDSGQQHSEAAGNGQCTALLALDISAFDAVNHATLTDRARTVFGIHDVALDWL